MSNKIFLRNPKREEVFIKKTKENITRKESREHLAQLHLACDITKAIHHFFPDLLPQLARLKDPRHPSYLVYSQKVLLMTRILSSLFYISSMRNTSAEFNNSNVIENIGVLCGEPQLEELPYWETINRYLERLEPAQLQDVIFQLARRLLRSRAFEESRIRGTYWQVIVDGTQLASSRRTLDDKALYRDHRKGTEEEYRESYYYVLEAKLLLRPDLLISLATEFVENPACRTETEKQDCERKACYRMMEHLREAFPRLPLCLCADSLYACGPLFTQCQKRGWKYLLRFKPGSLPSVFQEYQSLQAIDGNRQEETDGELVRRYDFVTDIGYEGHTLQLMEYQERETEEGKKKETTRKETKKKGKGTGKDKGTGNGKKKQEAPEGSPQRFYFLTNLPVSRKNVKALVERGRWRWKIENEGFNTQKNHGYYLEHPFSHDYQATKNHYYLIQIGHMIAQVIEAWEAIWKKVPLSLAQKHRRLLEAWKGERLQQWEEELMRPISIRFCQG